MSKSPPITLQASRPSLGDGERAAMERALASGYFGAGPEARAFEAELGEYFGGAGVACVNTGTSALHLAVAALGIGAGDEVLVPSLTFVASFQAVAVTGACPVACDVGLEDGLLDVEDARRRITSRTRAIMPVHYAGFPGDLAAVRRLASDHGLRVIEDAAHAFGSVHEGVRVGARADIACFSFDPIKNITCGQGGAVVSGDAGFMARVARMRNLSIERAAAGEGDAVEVRDLGWRYALSDLNAAIGRVQLARFEATFAPLRRALAARYRARLEGCQGLRLLQSGPGIVPHIFPVCVAGGRRDALRRELAAAGCESLVHYKPAHLLERFAGKDCPRTEMLYAELLTLPLHCSMSEGDVDRVALVVRDFLGSR